MAEKSELTDILAAWSESTIVADGWDEQQIFQYLTQECRLKAPEAISEMNVRLRGLLWCIRRGTTLLQAPPRANPIPGHISWRRKGKGIETVIWPTPHEALFLRALPEDVRAMWPKVTKAPSAQSPTDERIQAVKTMIETLGRPGRGGVKWKTFIANVHKTIKTSWDDRTIMRDVEDIFKRGL